MARSLFILLLSASLACTANSEVNDPLFDQQWGLLNTEYGFDINAPQAWDIEKGNKRVAIVIIDTGVDYTHPDLVDNMWINPSEIPGNGIDDDHNGYIDDVHGINAITGSGDPMDDNGHGTHVAGIIGARGNNEIGISGVMQQTSLIACKLFDANGGGTHAAALKCMDYVSDLAQRDDIDVKIVATNNAWGGGSYSLAMLNAIKTHRDLGILFVAGSGSMGHDLDRNPVFPAGYDASNVIVAAKMDRQGRLLGWSNYGPSTVHLAAPGKEIFSTWLDGSYKSLSGSAATAFVAGAVGLVSAHYPNLSAAQVKHRILAGTVRFENQADEEKLITGGYLDIYNSLMY